MKVKPLLAPLLEGSPAYEGRPTLFVSRDGTLLAVATEEFGADKFGQAKSYGHFFRAYHDFSSGRSAAATQTRPFSQQTRALLAARGGKVVLELNERRLGMWRWQDRDYKNFQVQ